MGTILAIISLLASGGLYLALSWRMHQHTHRLDDLLPLTGRSHLARIFNSKEFNSAITAPTLSLATVVLAFAELASYMGGWLLWTVVTTAAGIAVVRVTTHAIWRKINQSKSHRPTLHGFLGNAFQSEVLVRSAALCTSAGFLGAFAVELTVGTKFLAALAPEIPTWIAILVLAGIGVAYTALGGFRAVVVTDRVQMWAIWTAIGALIAVIAWQISERGGLSFIATTMPRSIYDFSWREGLGAFLIGIAVINVPTFLADMSIWQRIGAAESETVAARGLGGSVISASISWGLLVLIACFLVILVPNTAGTNPLFTFIAELSRRDSVIFDVLFVVIVAGLYSASLSTASTQLIVTAHTLHTDILRRHKDHEQLAAASHELAVSRTILIGSAVVSVVIVEALTLIGFSIADLVFAVYGAQLGMVPAVLIGIFGDQQRRHRVGTWASVAVISGFFVGWACAAAGTLLGDGDLVFLAPAASLLFSSAVLSLGMLMTTRPRSEPAC